MRLSTKSPRSSWARCLGAVLLGVLVAVWTPALAFSGVARVASAAESPQAATIASMEIVHASYLDLTGNIADLRSRVGEWQKGDEASLNIAIEKLERIEVILGYVGGAWPQPMAAAIGQDEGGRRPDAARHSRPRTRPPPSRPPKALGDASHDLTHAFYGD